ncbi:VOC family protein [Sphaerisporangium sp. TRM90804]|uniref:VOC family protein n=1 Tax=Sphaerisporangium sp. TRM90804 TaxID=3031113 RepID=UPI00244AA00F|nr:VOC family protein [Sphaerisporangium sp. TRM90804]MDH2424348.1 VOC family protein [Sphaerisporangium sp. TRM90804]
MADETTVPILPCRSIDEVEEFYLVLGFTRTFRQVRPNPYLALRREDLHLHFFGMPGFEPNDSYGSCVVTVPDTGALFQAFADGMRSAYGKLLISGIPRMTRPRKRKNAGDLAGFTVVDPGGNWIRIFPSAKAAEPEEPAPGRLAEALRNAVVIGDSHGDHRQAAKVLDGALARAQDPPNADLVEALLYRAELALTLADRERAGELLARVRELTLDAAERERLAGSLAGADDLERILSAG